MLRVTLLRICKFFVDLARILVPVLFILAKILLWILVAAVALLLLIIIF